MIFSNYFFEKITTALIVEYFCVNELSIGLDETISNFMLRREFPHFVRKISVF